MTIVSALKERLNVFCRESERSGASVLKIIALASYARLRFGIGVNFFIMTGIMRRPFEHSALRQYISNKDFLDAIEILNPPAYRKITQHKFIEKALYKSLHIASAELLGYYHEQRGVETKTGTPLTNLQQLNYFLSGFEEKIVCLKLCEGWSGRGFFAGKVTLQNGNVLVKKLFSEEIVPLVSLIEGFRNTEGDIEFIIESYIEQSESIGRFNPTSVNTIRTWVIDDGDSISVIGAAVRVGRKGSLTDNSGAGGIIVPVSVENGELGCGLLPGDPVRAELESHPDTNVVFQGQSIHRWPEIVSFSCDVLRKLPQTRFAGLDVSLTDNGPILIETNPLPDKDTAAKANIPAIKLVLAAKNLRKRNE